MWGIKRTGGTENEKGLWTFLHGETHWPLPLLSMYFLIGTRTLLLILWILARFKPPPPPHTHPSHTHTPSFPFPLQISFHSLGSAANTNTHLKAAGATELPVHHTKLGRNSFPRHSSLSLWLSRSPPLRLAELIFLPFPLSCGFPESALLQRVDYSGKPCLIKDGPRSTGPASSWGSLAHCLI